MHFTAGKKKYKKKNLTIKNIQTFHPSFELKHFRKNIFVYKGTKEEQFSTHRFLNTRFSISLRK